MHRLPYLHIVNSLRNKNLSKTHYPAFLDTRLNISTYQNDKLNTLHHFPRVEKKSICISDLK
ncbi:hypothetical protein thsps21_60550 [Pseudomonas sp. No.21]|nr:hypothetical protein TUM20249_62250 [Pseudomonas tohonis]